MASNLMSPTGVEVRTTISFHEAISAVEHFADKYPAERMCLEQAERLERAASAIRTTLGDRGKTEQQRNTPLPAPTYVNEHGVIERLVCAVCGHSKAMHERPDTYSACVVTDSEGPCLCQGFKS